MDTTMAKVLIAGCGYVGTALGLRLVASGHHVVGLRRHVGDLPPSLSPLAADLTRPRSLSRLPPGLDVVFYTAAADDRTAAAYRAAYPEGLANLLTALHRQGQFPRRVVFTSSVSVYGQARGEWVDEDSPTQPSGPSGQLVLEAERVLFGGDFPAVALRLAGIYGPGRTSLLDSVRSGRARCRPGEPDYTNRIHVDDCAAALEHLLSLENPDPVYVGADHEPAPRCEVLRWLAARIGADPAPLELGTSASRRGEGSKRCRNTRLVGSGYRFRFPTFREGYADLLGS